MKRLFLIAVTVLAIFVPPVLAKIVVPQPHVAVTVSVWTDTVYKPGFRYARWDDQGPFSPGDTLVASGLAQGVAIDVLGPNIVFYSFGTSADFTK